MGQDVLLGRKFEPEKDCWTKWIGRERPWALEGLLGHNDLTPTG
jgi:hypothetical protein